MAIGEGCGGGGGGGGGCIAGGGGCIPGGGCKGGPDPGFLIELGECPIDLGGKLLAFPETDPGLPLLEPLLEAREPRDPREALVFGRLRLLELEPLTWFMFDFR